MGFVCYLNDVLTGGFRLQFLNAFLPISVQ